MVSIPNRGGGHKYRLKIGSIVKLKSDLDGQPPMTVGVLFGQLVGHVTVQWRDKTGKPHAGQYHEDALVEFDPTTEKKP